MPRHLTTHRIVCWRVSRFCNRSCSFCLSDSGPQRSRSSHDARSVVARLLTLGVRKLTYSGGEPVLDPGLPGALEAGSAAGLEQVVTSNGDLLARRVPEFLKLATYVKLSFYGGEQTHDAIMEAGHFRRLMLACQKLDDVGIPVGANYMLSRRSEDDAVSFLNNLRGSPIRNVVFLTYIPSARSFRANAEFQLRSETAAIAGLTRRLESGESAYDGGVKVHNYAAEMFYVILEENLRLVMPNGPDEFVMGRVFDDQLALPGKGLVPAAQALDQVWTTRETTPAIIPMGS